MRATAPVLTTIATALIVIASAFAGQQLRRFNLPPEERARVAGQMLGQTGVIWAIVLPVSVAAFFLAIVICSALPHLAERAFRRQAVRELAIIFAFGLGIVALGGRYWACFIADRIASKPTPGTYIRSGLWAFFIIGLAIGVASLAGASIIVGLGWLGAGVTAAHGRPPMSLHMVAFAVPLLIGALSIMVVLDGGHPRTEPVRRTPRMVEPSRRVAEHRQPGVAGVVRAQLVLAVSRERSDRRGCAQVHRGGRRRGLGRVDRGRRPAGEEREGVGRGRGARARPRARARRHAGPVCLHRRPPRHRVDGVVLAHRRDVAPGRWRHTRWTSHIGRRSGSGWHWILLGPVGLMSLAFLLSCRVDVNEFSMHHFYKNRLVRCYLGAARDARTDPSRRSPDPFTGFDAADDLSLADLHLLCGRGDEALRAAKRRGNPRDLEAYVGPIPIVNTALNLVKGDDLAWQERKAQSFVFTPFYSGYDFQSRRDRPDPPLCPVRVQADARSSAIRRSASAPARPSPSPAPRRAPTWGITRRRPPRS